MRILLSLAFIIFACALFAYPLVAFSPEGGAFPLIYPFYMVMYSWPMAVVALFLAWLMKPSRRKTP